MLSFLLLDRLLYNAKLDLRLPCAWLRSEATKFARPLKVVVTEGYLAFTSCAVAYG